MKLAHRGIRPWAACGVHLWLLAAFCAQASAQPAPAAPAAPAAPVAPSASAAADRPPVCNAPWFRGGARAQLEADGDMPMSITMRVRHPSTSAEGCSAWIDIQSKSALAAIMGPPVIMDQVHKITFDRLAGSPDGRISSQRATINAQARYTRLFGEASFEGTGMFTYAGHDIREGATLAGEVLRSSADLSIHALATDEQVTTIRVPHASIYIGERHVGRRQTIDTALGRRECLPISYDKHTSLGLVYIGEEVEELEPFTMEVTDWYCPSEAFVLRTEIRQDGKAQAIDTTAIGTQ
jgi:hypothetical protein